MDYKEKPAFLLKVFILIVIILSLLGVSDDVIRWIGDIWAHLFISAIFSVIAGTIIEQLTGDSLKKTLLPIKIGNFSFSFSLFLISIILLKFWLFH